MTSRRVRSFVALSVVGVLFSWAAVPAGAASDDGPDLTLEPRSVFVGDSIEVTGIGFGLSEGVDVFFDTTDLALRVTDARGEFSATIAVPKGATAGTHWVSALGRASGELGRVKIEVRGTAAWPQVSYDAARTAWNPEETALTPATVGGLVSRWTAAIAPFGYVEGAVASASTAYLWGSGMAIEDDWDEAEPFLAAIDLDDGDVVWQRAFTDTYLAQVALGDDVLLVSFTRAWSEDATSFPSTLLGLDPSTGETRWSTDLSLDRENDVSGMIVSDGAVFVTAYGHREEEGRGIDYAVSAIDTGDGTVRWQAFEDDYLSTPVIADDLLIVGTDHGPVAFDPETGDVVWRRPSPYGNWSVAAVPGRLYVPVPSEMWEGSSVVAMDLGTRGPLWEMTWDLGVGSFAVTPERVLVAGHEWESSFGELRALDPANGSVVWSASTTFWGDPVAAGDVFYAAGGGTLTARDVDTGERLFVADGVDRVFGVVNGRVLAGTSETPGLTVFAAPTPPAPRAGALVADRSRQPDRAIEPHTTLTDGWTALETGAAGADVAVVGTAVLGDTTYVGTRAAEGGGLYRLVDGTLERVGTPGLGDPANTALRPVVTGTALWVVTDNQHGVQVWRSTTGETFSLVADRGFGDPGNHAALPMVIAGRLVVGVTNTRTGAQLWTASSSPGAPFVKVLGVPAAPVEGFTPPVVFDGRTYVGTTGPTTTTLLRTDDAVVWDEIAVASPRGTISIAPQLEFAGALYATAANPDGLRLLRTTDGQTFVETAIEMTDRAHASTIDGRMAVVGDRLIVIGSSLDPRRSIGATPIEVAPERGFEVWTSTDGEAWTRVPSELLGDRHDIGGVPLVADDTLYLAVANHEEGDSVFVTSDTESWDAMYREASTSHASLGLTPLLVDGYLVLFHGDELEGLTGWRSDEPVATGSGLPRWTWAVVLLLVTLVVVALALLGRRGRHAGPRLDAPHRTPAEPAARERINV